MLSSPYSYWCILDDFWTNMSHLRWFSNSLSICRIGKVCMYGTWPCYDKVTRPCAVISPLFLLGRPTSRDGPRDLSRDLPNPVIIHIQLAEKKCKNIATWSWRRQHGINRPNTTSIACAPSYSTNASINQESTLMHYVVAEKQPPSKYTNSAFLINISMSYLESK